MPCSYTTEYLTEKHTTVIVSCHPLKTCSETLETTMYFLLNFYFLLHVSMCSSYIHNYCFTSIKAGHPWYKPVFNVHPYLRKLGDDVATRGNSECCFLEVGFCFARALWTRLADGYKHVAQLATKSLVWKQLFFWKLCCAIFPTFLPTWACPLEIWVQPMSFSTLPYN
jgi:hypothetical protein